MQSCSSAVLGTVSLGLFDRELAGEDSANAFVRCSGFCGSGNGALEATNSRWVSSSEAEPGAASLFSFSNFCRASYARMLFSFFSLASLFWNQF
jgi:hypothetical protein